MTFIELPFFIFLFISVLIYYVVPIKRRWIVLLLASIIFYLFAGWKKLIFVVLTCAIAYIVAIKINKIYADDKSEDEDIEKKAKAKIWLIVGIVAVLFFLIYSKIGRNLVEAIFKYSSAEGLVEKIIIPLGISYYSFGLICYMADVYWKKDTAEKNPLKLLLYMIYFPQILQGPIPRHNRLAKQFESPKPFAYKEFCFGLQRMLWGYFKKMVIADRFGVIVRNVFGNYDDYQGQVFVLAILFSAIQLYCDFSGCMDIAIGISEALGLKLDENFKRPFFSKTAAEFWRRWHITLGTWFKDYIYMPMVINPKLIGVSKKVKDKFGTKVARNIMVIIPLTVVWLLTGLWHGTGLDYILWGFYWGIIIIVSTVFSAEFRKLSAKLNIDTTSLWWNRFQTMRTFILFLGSRLLTAPGDIKKTEYIIKSMFTCFNPWIWYDRSIYELGINRRDFWIGIYAVILLWFISIKQEKGVKIRETVSELPLPLRWSLYYSLLFSIVLFGMYGLGYDTADFVYMNY